MKIFFAIAASSAAIFCVPLYNIVMPYLRHFGSFAPKIGDFERKIGANDMRKLLYYNNFRVGVFFLKKFSRAEGCAESEVIRNSCEFDFQPIHYLFCFACR